MNIEKTSKAKYLVVAFIISIITIIPLFKVLAFTDIIDENGPNPDDGYIGRVFYNNKSGFCKFWNVGLFTGEPTWGDYEKRYQCWEHDWVAFCPDFNGGENGYTIKREDSNCNCLNGMPIEFSELGNKVGSKDFIDDMSNSLCSLPGNIPSEDIKSYAEAKIVKFGLWLFSKAGKAHSAMRTIDGCNSGCGIMGGNCLDFFANNDPLEEYKDDDLYIYEYKHPLFTPLNPNIGIKASAGMIMEFMKRNNQLLSELGGNQKKCNESDLKELLDWPDGCGLSDSKGGSFRDGDDGWHGSGQAIDITCKEPVSNDCGPKTKKVYEIMQRYWGGNRILIECTPSQRGSNCADNSGSSQVIHIDMGPYSQPYPASTISNGGCLPVSNDPPTSPEQLDDFLEFSHSYSSS